MKKAVKKAAKKKQVRTKSLWVAVSGGFDPIHIGHLRMFKAARTLGDKLVVIINNDNWLRLKKGYVFMPQKERGEIIGSFPFVDKVVFTDHTKSDSDMSVARMLKKLQPAIFANGGDRNNKTTPEDTVCAALGIKRAYGVGWGGKVQSSSWMIRDAIAGVLRSVRPWGEFYGWNKGNGWYLKTVHVAAGKRLSLQYHHHRKECWVLVQGDAVATLGDGVSLKKTALKIGEPFFVPKTAAHRLESKRGGTIVEIALGSFDENDIVRLADDHGRV